MSPLRMSLAVSAAVAMVFDSTSVAATQSAPEFDSPSEIDATGRGAQTQITYTNQTDHTLTCVVHVGDPEIVRAMRADAAPGDGPIDNDTLLAQIDAAMDEGRLALAMGDVPAGQTAEILLLFPLTDYSSSPSQWGTVAVTDRTTSRSRPTCRRTRSGPWGPSTSSGPLVPEPAHSSRPPSANCPQKRGVRSAHRRSATNVAKLPRPFAVLGAFQYLSGQRAASG